MQLRFIASSLLLSLSLAACAQPADPTRAIDADGAVVDAPVDSPASTVRVLSELTLPNGNLVTFARHADGGMEVREQGAPRTNAVGMVPQLASASPYEIFLAIAPRGLAVPPELIADQALIVAGRARRGEVSSMPDGFRVDANPAFYATHLERAFNACTDVAAWEDTTGSIGANCPSSGVFAFNQCVSNYLPPDLSSCAGTSCTEFFTAGYHQSRATVCARTGDGSVEFTMGIRDHGGSFSTWFDHMLGTGSYYVYFYSHATQEKDFWRIIAHTGAGTRRVNKSWWLKN